MPASTSDEVAHDPPGGRESSSRRVRDLALCTLLTGLALLGIITAVLPQAPIKRSITTVTKPIVQFIGLDQGWGVFAPNAPNEDMLLTVYVTMSNGEERVWTRNDAHPPVEWFTINRWFSFERELIERQELRKGFADWVVQQVTRPGEKPVHVRMVYEANRLPPPGVNTGPVTRTKVLYDKKLARSK